MPRSTPTRPGDVDATTRHAEVALHLFDELGMPIDAGSRRRLLSQGLLLRQGAGRPGISPTPAGRPSGTSRALIARCCLLATALADAHETLGDMPAMADYDDRRLQLAEGLGDRDALARAQLGLAIRLSAIGAPETGMALLVSAADIARARTTRGACRTP